MSHDQLFKSATIAGLRTADEFPVFGIGLGLLGKRIHFSSSSPLDTWRHLV
jgi:hypothetical protein